MWHVWGTGGQDFGAETWGKETAWKTQAQMGYNIKRYIKEIGCGGMDWIDLTQDRDRWQALVNAVMNLRVP